MVLEAATDETRQMTAPQPTSPMLRISRGGAPEKSIPLMTGKCTIGSSPRCQVLLPASDARPMHCLVALEAGAVTATRWAAGVLLNGKEFAVAPLASGDRLTIGPWEIALEQALVDVAPSSLATQTAATTACESAPPVAVDADQVETQPTAPAAEETQPAPCRALVVVEPSIRPTTANPLRLPAAESKQLQQVEEALAELIAEASAPAPPKRNGAKTQLLASRKTAPVIVPPPVRPSAAVSQTFADRLLLRLWTANHQARSRFALLLDATRRTVADAASAAACEAAARDELVRSRASHDADRETWSTEVAELNANAAALQAELAERIAQQQQFHDELTAGAQSATEAAAQSAAAAAEANARLVELTREYATAEETLAALRQELEECEARFAQLASERTDAAAVRENLETRLAAAQERTEQLQADIERLVQEHAAALQAAYAERDELREALIALEAAITSPEYRPEYEAAEQATPQDSPEQPPTELEASEDESWEPAFTSNDAEEEAAIADASVESPPEADEWFSRWRGEHPAADALPPEASYDDEPAEQVVEVDELADSAPEPEQPADEYAGEATGDADNQFAPALVDESPEPEYAPTSYIERYRDMLNDEPKPTQASSPARALLDEEYLSPAQARKGDDPHDDSDEALAAYMSNLMRRVRGDGGVAVSVGMADRSAALAPGLVNSPVADNVQVEPTAPLEPLDLEGLRATRREARPVDLAALREIANDSTRLAMAEHKERQHVESTMNRGILFGMAAAASAYSLYEAPGVGSIWFWAGAAAAFAAGGLGIQLAMLLRRRFALQSRRLDPLAAITPTIDFSALEMPLTAPVLQH